MRWLGWIIAWGGIFLAFVALLSLIPYGHAHGWGAVTQLTLDEYRLFMNSVFGWTGPHVEHMQATRAGHFPLWWREGVIMLAIIVSQWSQAVSEGKATLRDAMEYLAVSAIAGAGSYYLGAATSLAEAAFFAIGGVFAQLLARGLVSLVDGRASEPEAWAGRYLLRSTSILVLAAGAFLGVNAGLKLGGIL
jgi:hypothetical protein